MAVRLRARRLAQGAALGGGLAVLLAGCAAPPGPGGGGVGPDAAARSAPERASAERFGTLTRLGDAARRSGDHGAAVSLYRQATAVDPSQPRGHIALGEALLESGDPDAAARAFQEALGLAPADRDAERGYARSLLELGQPEEALPRYEALVEADPADVRALNGLGVALDLTGRHEEAQATYRKGLARQPGDLALRNNLGLSLVLAGRPEEAITVLRRVAEARGATSRNRQNLALAYGLAGDLASAERIGRIDLSHEAVRQNLAFYTEVGGQGRGLDGAALRRPAAVDAIPATAPVGREEPAASSHAGAPSAAAAPRPPSSEPPVTKPIVIKLEAQVAAAAADEPVRTAERRAAPDEPAATAVTTTAAPAADTDTSRGATPAAPAGSGAADVVAVDAQGLQLGRADEGSWFLELGEYADGGEAAAAWRDLRRHHGGMLAGLNRLASIHRGRQQLLVGPVASGSDARELCLRLKGSGQTCRAVLL